MAACPDERTRPTRTGDARRTTLASLVIEISSAPATPQPTLTTTRPAASASPSGGQRSASATASRSARKPCASSVDSSVTSAWMACDGSPGSDRANRGASDTPRSDLLTAPAERAAGRSAARPGASSTMRCSSCVGVGAGSPAPTRGVKRARIGKPAPAPPFASCIGDSSQITSRCNSSEMPKLANRGRSPADTPLEVSRFGKRGAKSTTPRHTTLQNHLGLLSSTSRCPAIGNTAARGYFDYFPANK